jgi:hypothetical protein
VSSLSYEPLYEAENANAIVPRILFDVESVDQNEPLCAEEHISQWGTSGLPGFDAPRIIASDTDGRLFVDYLLDVWDDDDFMTAHKKVISEYLSEAVLQRNTRALEKIYWLGRYHNISLSRDDESMWWYSEAVETYPLSGGEDEHGGVERSELRVDLSMLPHGLEDPLPNDT